MTKNLKKVISAVAALSISASAVSAFAVTFPDVPADASYAQAVQELSALDIISGYEDGTFRPDELVTRAQMAKMIVDALGETTLAEASSGSTKFADVSADHWAKGYINQGVSDGFIAGYSDTEFGPDDNVTYVQAQKMIVSAIGYETFAQAAGGWPNGYKQYAASTGITSGISGIADDTQLTRAQVAQLLDNGMDAPVCVIIDWTTQWNGTRTPNLEVKDGEGKDYQTLFTKMHNAYKVYGRVTKTNKTDNSIDTDQVEFRVEKADNFDDEYIKASNGDEITENMYFGDTNAPDLLLTYSQALIQIDDDDEYHIISITPAAANKSVALAAEDFDYDKSVDNKLYFYPAGTTKNSTKYTLADSITVYVNGTENDMSFDELVEYIDSHETASVILQKETKQGSTSTDTDYNLIMINAYETAIVSEVVEKSDQIDINFDQSSSNINKSRMIVYTDDENYTYSFTLDGEAIDPLDLQEDDVLSIAYDQGAGFNDSMYYDVLVSRDTADGKCTTISTSTPTEYTIGGTKYKAAEGMNPDIETSTEYTLYLDHFGRIAKADEDSVTKKLGILKNIYKKAGGDWYAQVITKEGTEEEYKVDEKNYVDYAAYLKVETVDADKSVAWSVANNGVTYGTGDNSKLARYPEQVIEYSVSTTSNKITIKGTYSGTYANDQEYKASGDKIGTVKMSDTTVIIDISDVNAKDEYRVVSESNLTDGNNYSAYGYDRTTSGDRYYRFVLITDGVSSFNSDTQLAIFNGSELVAVEDEDKDAYNLIINGEEVQYVLDDDCEFIDVNGTLQEGDPVLFTVNAAGDVTKIQGVFAGTNVLNGTNYSTFRSDALDDLDGVLAHKSGDDGYWNNLLDGTSDDMDIVFGVVVDKRGSSVTLIQEKDLVTVDGSDGVWANYDTGLDLDCSGAKVYAYDFAASSKNSRVFLDNGLQSTPDYKSAKTTDNAGNDLLNLTDDEVIDDIVFAVARVDNDEVQEIYLIINED